MDPMIQALIDYGVAGVFLAYMIWSKAKDQSRADALQTRYETKLENLRITNSSDQEKIRDRYRDVVDKYESQIKSYGEERQKQIVIYAEERAATRKRNDELKTELVKTLKDISLDVSENGKSIAVIQTQIESLNMRMTGLQAS